MTDDGAGYHERAIDFLCQAVEMALEDGQRGTLRRVYSEDVFRALGWPDESKRYFAAGVLNMVHYLQQRELIEQVEQAYPYSAGWLKYSFVPTAGATEWCRQKRDDRPK